MLEDIWCLKVLSEVILVPNDAGVSGARVSKTNSPTGRHVFVLCRIS